MKTILTLLLVLGLNSCSLYHDIAAPTSDGQPSGEQSCTPDEDCAHPISPDFH